MVETYSGRVRSLVDNAKGIISRDIFVSDELYAQEQERVFARSWLFVGHESQVPKPNDFFVSRMGEEEVILTRDRQGKIHVLLNSCSHRGMKVCRYDEGNTPVFSCPYHGWSFSTDGNLVSVPGELIGVPQFATAYHGELDKPEWGLSVVPKMHVYKGSVWACWDKGAPEWDEYMGGMKVLLDGVFDAEDGEPGGRMVFGGMHKWLMPCNWKFAAENFIGDGYHATTSHRSATLNGMMGAGRIPHTNSRLDNRLSVSFPYGHGVLGLNHPDDWNKVLPFVDSPRHPDYQNPEIGEYFKEAYEKKMRLRGGLGPQRSASTVFPNMSFGGGPSSYTIAVWHPAGARVTEAWRWYLVDKDAPEVVKKAWLEEQIGYAGPLGAIEQDDMENWGYATAASKGTMARRRPYNYQQGVGRETRHPAFPGALVKDRQGSSEQNQRGFYGWWAQMMDAEHWHDLRK